MIREKLFLATLVGALSLGSVATLAQENTDPGVTGTGTSTGADATSRTGTDKGMGAQGGSQFDELDTNRDNALDQDEFGAAGVGTDYESLDVDGDDSVSRDEFELYSQE